MNRLMTTMNPFTNKAPECLAIKFKIKFGEGEYIGNNKY